MREEWVCFSRSRQHRPFLPPKEFCPLCIQTREIIDPEGRQVLSEIPVSSKPYEWAAFENLFPGLSKHNQTGHCEVLLYSPNHHETLASASRDQIEGLVRMWQDRSGALNKVSWIQQVFIFENKGAEVGVTLHHPHGQLYAFAFPPNFIAREQAAAGRYYQKENKCLICSLVQKEIRWKQRLVFENDTMVAYVPESARYPYEVHVSCKPHRPHIEQLDAKETADLAEALQGIVKGYNTLFDRELPFLMVHHQSPAHKPDDPSYHWHIEFYPPYRTAQKLKYLAGVEAGTGVFLNDTLPEDKAAELREVIP